MSEAVSNYEDSKEIEKKSEIYYQKLSKIGPLNSEQPYLFAEMIKILMVEW